MAFPTNIVNQRLMRATCWSLVLHVAVLWPALVLVTPLGGVLGRVSPAATSSRLDGRLRVASVVAPSVSPSDDLARRSMLKGEGHRLPSPGTARGIQAKASPQAAQAVANEDAVVDADDLRAYRMTLALQARPYWRYPTEARQAGKGGAVEVRIAFSSNGRSWVSLERSSGHRSLDDAAQEMLRAAVANAQQPEALRGKAFSLVMPVVFEPGSEAGR